MVFCGTSLERLDLLVSAGTLEELAGRAATRTLLASHGVAPEHEEDADFLAQSLASLDSMLAGDGPRVVVAVDAERTALTVVEESVGHIRLTPFDWSWVTAVFVDEPGAETDAARAAAREAMVATDVRVGEPGRPKAVTTLLEDHPLLWFLPTELDEVRALHG